MIHCFIVAGKRQGCAHVGRHMLILISRKMSSLWSVLLVKLLVVYLPLVCVGEDPEIHYSPVSNKSSVLCLTSDILMTS